MLSPNPSAFSLSTLPTTLQLGDARGAAPLPGVGDFPELAAMEADFQRSLARGLISLFHFFYKICHMVENPWFWHSSIGVRKNLLCRLCNRSFMLASSFCMLPMLLQQGPKGVGRGWG